MALTNRSVLLVIPARGGSKRLPRKNLLDLAGKPLIAWSIEAAIEAASGDILVSSDDKEILSIARKYADQAVHAHCRPAQLAEDQTSMVSVLLDVLEYQRGRGYRYETLVLVQPTSPLRASCDIQTAVDRYLESGTGSTVVTVCGVEHPTAWTGTINEAGNLIGIDLSAKRSQDYEQEYRLNGAVYVVSTSTLEQNQSLFSDRLIPSIMPRDRSVDIDDQADFDLAEYELQKY